MFWRNFTTKTAAENAVREIINPQPFKIPFEAPLISDLILERHYFCSLHGLRPGRFRKLPGYGCYSFEGDFGNQPTPIPIEWHRVSWKKCLDKPLTAWELVVRAMRDRIEPIKSDHRQRYPICEACRECATEEAHHSEPTFTFITTSIRSSVSDADISDCLKDWNWFVRDHFMLPEGHEITKLFDKIHATAKLQSLCRGCHNKTKRKNL